MRRVIFPFLPLVATIACVVAAFGTGDDTPVNDTGDIVFLGEVDLAERAEIWRNQYRRMTPGDEPLVQDVGAWPAAWEEFGSHWAVAPATRGLATWLVLFSAERTGNATVIRDANGTVLWSGTTDFAKDESANVTLTGNLVDEADWPLYDAARWEVLRRTDVYRPGFRDGEGGGTNNTPTNDPDNMFVSHSAVFTNDTPEFRVGLKWTNDITLDIWVYAPVCTFETHQYVFTNDENMVQTNISEGWRSPRPVYTGLASGWEYAGTVSLTNGVETVFVDTNYIGDRWPIRFYAAFESLDFDGDGLNDVIEDILGISTNSVDHDQDGIDDFTELAAGGAPTVSNVWFVTTTTNNIFEHFPLDNCQPNAPCTNVWGDFVRAHEPTKGSVVSNVVINGFVDDAIMVDAHGVEFLPDLVTFTNRCITNEIRNLQTKRFFLTLFDWPRQDYYGPNEARIGNSLEDPFRVEWTWICPLDFRLEHINTDGNPLLVNPAGPTTNKAFTCQATVLPDAFPDSNIFWSCTNAGMSFVGGVTNGRSVQLTATQLGDWEATVSVHVNPTNTLTGTLHGTVLEKKTVPVYLHIVREDDGTGEAMSLSSFQTLLDGANQIWEQASIEFQLDTTCIVYTNKSDWLDISSNNFWQEYIELQSIDSHTGGLEIYCVRSLDDDVVGLTYMGQNVAAGLTIACTATAGTLAHELGHACGLLDIYTSWPADTPTVFFPANATNAVEQTFEPNDWCASMPNGGYGFLTQSNLVHRLLMFGFDEVDAVDIPAGMVQGLDKNGTITNLPVGLSNLGNRQPQHW